MSRPNSSDPHICRSEGGDSRVARLICAGSWGAIHGAKTANTIKQATKTQPIAASGLRLARRGSEITLVAICRNSRGQSSKLRQSPTFDRKHRKRQWLKVRMQF